MKIKYEFVTGETVEIEVTGELEKIMIEMEREEKPVERKETRRHESLGEEMESSWLEDEKACVDAIVSENEVDKKLLRKMTDVLTPKQLDAFVNVCIGGMTEAEYAHIIGTSQQAVDHFVSAAKRKLEKALSCCKK